MSDIARPVLRRNLQVSRRWPSVPLLSTITGVETCDGSVRRPLGRGLDAPRLPGYAMALGAFPPARYVRAIADAWEVRGPDTSNYGRRA